jgi:hypothetical protein
MRHAALRQRPGRDRHHPWPVSPSAAALDDPEIAGSTSLSVQMVTAENELVRAREQNASLLGSGGRQLRDHHRVRFRGSLSPGDGGPVLWLMEERRRSSLLPHWIADCPTNNDDRHAATGAFRLWSLRDEWATGGRGRLPPGHPEGEKILRLQSVRVTRPRPVSAQAVRHPSRFLDAHSLTAPTTSAPVTSPNPATTSSASSSSPAAESLHSAASPMADGGPSPAGDAETAFTAGTPASPSTSAAQSLRRFEAERQWPATTGPRWLHHTSVYVNFLMEEGKMTAGLQGRQVRSAQGSRRYDPTNPSASIRTSA